MITLGTKEFRTDEAGISQIQERVAANTCKTNLNPQLILRQSYTGLTNKVFVGNWTKDGFWLSKYRLQLFQLRPDIITRFSIQKETTYQKVTMKSSIGFSSLFLAMIFILLFSAPFASLGTSGFLMIVTFMVIFYALLASREYDKMMKAINDTIIKDIRKG